MFCTHICWYGSMAEQLICNQQVVGSTPTTSFKCEVIMIVRLYEEDSPEVAQATDKKYVLATVRGGGEKGSGAKLYRIKALKDFDDVKAGSYGGWVASEANLSQEGECWIYNESVVVGDARVTGDAKVKNEGTALSKIFGKATVSGNAEVCGSWVYEDAAITGSAEVHLSKIHNRAKLYGGKVTRSEVFGDAQIIMGTLDAKASVSGTALVRGGSLYGCEVSQDASISGECVITGATIEGHAAISEKARVTKDAGILEISDNAIVKGSANIHTDSADDAVYISDNAKVYGKAEVTGNSYIRDEACVFGNAVVRGNKDKPAQVYSDVQVFGTAEINNRVFSGNYSSGAH